MSLKPIPLFGIGIQGRSAALSSQSRTNLYVELPPDDEKGTIALFPTAGLEMFVDLGSTPIRGVHVFNGFAFIVHKDIVYIVSNNGQAKAHATKLSTTTGRVSIADNGTQICIVDGVSAYIVNVAENTITKVAISATHVIFLDSYFVACTTGKTGQFQISNSYNGLVWDPLDYATAEASPDPLVRIIADAGALQLFGETTLEPWLQTGGLDFPFSRIGSGSIEWGLAAQWSLTKFMDSLIFLRKNRLGQVQVCQQASSQAIPVSTPEIDYEISTYKAYSDATGFAYMMNGHPFYQINFPSANKSWLYDGMTKAWSRLESGTNGGRHLADIFFELLGKLYVTDFATGKIYRLNQDVYTDNGQTIVREVISRHQDTGDLTNLSQLWIELDSGQGTQTGQGFDPQIMLQISRDGGREWSDGIWRDAGKVGKYQTRAVWNRLGKARDWVFKFRMTDPVKWVILKGWAKRGW